MRGLKFYRAPKLIGDKLQYEYCIATCRNEASRILKIAQRMIDIMEPDEIYELYINEGIEESLSEHINPCFAYLFHKFFLIYLMERGWS